MRLPVLVLLVSLACLALFTRNTCASASAKKELKAIEDQNVVIADAPTAQQIAEDHAALASEQSVERSAPQISSSSYCDPQETGV